MGYSTDFSGVFTLNNPLTEEHHAYLSKFSDTRRMKRDAVLAESFSDPTRTAVNLPVGDEGGYFVGAKGFAGQEHDSSVVSYNNPPKGQPGLWCKWVPTEDGTGIEWSGAEKFYDYVEWIEYLIEHFLKPWGYVLNGKMRWRGENMDDIGIIIITDNRVEVKSVEW